MFTEQISRKGKTRLWWVKGEVTELKAILLPVAKLCFVEVELVHTPVMRVSILRHPG